MLFKLENSKQDYSKVKRVTLADIGWKEIDLQNLLSKHIQDLISTNELMTIFNERPRQEEPDILALDKDGDLYIFELKRWSSNQENLLQVLRYGQLLGNSSYDELNELYNKYINNGYLELSQVHQEYFKLFKPIEEFNKQQHFLVVTNGLDQGTIEAIIYWKKVGLNIDAIIYWVFEINNEYFIEFNMYSPIEGYLEYENNTYLLNTNFSNNQSHTDEMLQEEKAAAYYPGNREKIQKLQKGDLVFLYKSGAGIIAYGTASGKLRKRVCDGHADYEFYMKLEDFKKLKNPLSASDMKSLSGQGFNFRQTMTSISSNCATKLKIEIDKNYI